MKDETEDKLLGAVLCVPMILLFTFLIVVYGTMALIHKVFDPVFFWLFGAADCYQDFSKESRDE
jgi:hypothetical protein